VSDELTAREPEALLRPGWGAVIVTTLVLAVIALSDLVSLWIAGLLDPSFSDPEFPRVAWQTAFLWWSVSVPLALCAGLIVGRVVRESELGHRLWLAALGWTPVFLVFAIVFSMAAADDPAMLTTTSAGPFWESFWTFSAWGMGVPLMIAAGLKLATSRRGGVVEPRHRAGSRTLH
jgi:hypothetical protein